MTHLIFSKKNRIKTQSLCKDVQDISWRTWNLLRNAHLHDITVGEETITDINLLELQRRRTLTEVITKKLSRADEAMIGADWIWVLIGKSGRTLVLYVQAKKLFTSSGAYNSLIKSSNPFHQVNTLISNRFFFAGIPMYPIYVFLQLCCWIRKTDKM